MYIKYTFVDDASLLISQVLGAIPLPVSTPLAIEALSFGLRSRLGFLHGCGSLLATLLEVSLLLLLAFFETGGLFDHQHLMLLLDFHFRRFQHREKLGERLLHPLHVIVHHEAFIARWE